MRRQGAEQGNEVAEVVVPKEVKEEVPKEERPKVIVVSGLKGNPSKRAIRQNEVNKERAEEIVLNDKEQKLVELLRFKVMHLNAVTLQLNSDDKAEAETAVNELIQRMLNAGYTQERIDRLVHVFSNQVLEQKPYPVLARIYTKADRGRSR